MNVAYIPVFGAALVYGYQKSIDRKTALIELRRKSYRDFVEAFVDMTLTPEHNDAIKSAYMKKEFDLLIVGSDETIRAVSALNNSYSKTNDDRYNRDVDMTKQLVANVCSAMRNDCFEKTSLKQDDIASMTPFS